MSSFEEIFNFTLSYDNVKATQFDKYEKNFTFFVDGKPYKTNRIIADFLSPTIRKYHYIDEALDYFMLNTNLKKQKKCNTTTKSIDYFSEFLNLTKFDQVTLDQARIQHFSEYFLHLGNFVEFYKLQPNLFTELSPSNVIERLNSMTKVFKMNSCEAIDTIEVNKNQVISIDIGQINDLIQYAAENFDEIDKDELKSLDFNILEAIIANDSLKLDDEDALVDFVIDLYKVDVKYSILFEYVIFTNLKEKAIEKFINTFDINCMNSTIWNSICKRLIMSKSATQNEPRTQNQPIETFREFRRFEGGEFNGIINFLTTKTGGNVHLNDTVEITSNSVFRDFVPSNLVDYKSNFSYSSNNEPNVKVCFDFKNRKIQLDSYSIKSTDNHQNMGHMRNWVVEVSNDLKKWYIVDRRSNASDLNGPLITACFDLNRRSNNYYRYIQIRQTGESWRNGSGEYTVYFNMIEFFGKMKESRY